MIILVGGRIRKQGLELFALGSLLYVAAVFAMDRLRVNGGAFHYLLLPAWISFLVACFGFVEFASGAPCSQLRSRWPELAGWRRATIGAFLVVTALVVISCLSSFFVIWLA